MRAKIFPLDMLNISLLHFLDRVEISIYLAQNWHLGTQSDIVPGGGGRGNLSNSSDIKQEEVN